MSLALPQQAAPSAQTHALRLIHTGAICVVMVMAVGVFRKSPINLPMWLLLYSYFAMLVVATPRPSLAMLRWNLAMFAYPLVCLASIVWSELPRETLKNGVLIVLTAMTAVHIGWHQRLAGLVGPLVVGLGVGLTASVLNIGGAFGDAYGWGGEFQGIFGHKNSLGQCAGVALIVSAFLLLYPPRPKLVALAAVATMALVALVMLAMSRAATATLITAGGLGLFLSLAAFNISRLGRALVVVAAALVLSVLPMALVMLEVDLFGAILKAFEKNETLTGRTVV
ncbi:MAG: hypothetical protein AAF908_10740 [Pseudomonadota bacterium]